MTSLLNQVKSYATQHYAEDAWDIIIECYTDNELAALIGRASTLEGALRKCRAVIAPIAEERAWHRAEAQMGESGYGPASNAQEWWG